MTWKTVKLGDVAEIISGATPDTTNSEFWNGGIDWATPKDLSELKSVYISTTPRKLTQAGLQSCSSKVLPVNSVLFSSRAPIRHVAINTVPMCTNQGFKSFICDFKQLFHKFLYYWLKANRLMLENLGNGATFKEVSKSVIAKVEIPLPPLDEQKRIAAVLDKAELVRAQRRAAISKLDELVQSVFLDMFTPFSQWQSDNLINLIEEFRYGTSNKSGDAGFPALRIPNVVNQKIDLRDLKTVVVEDAEFSKLQLKNGDLLFVRTNGNPSFVGRCAVFEIDKLQEAGFDPNNFIFASYLIRARLKLQKISPKFIQSYLSMSEGRKELRSRCQTSAGQYNINTANLGTLPIILPPLELQDKFANILKNIEARKSRQKVFLTESDNLFQSIQQRAFAGELFGLESL